VHLNSGSAGFGTEICRFYDDWNNCYSVCAYLLMQKATHSCIM